MRPKILAKPGLIAASLFVGVLILSVFVNSNWPMHSAMATPVALALKLTGPQTAQAGQTFSGIDVRLVNAKAAAQNARLRLFITDEAGRDLQLNDIKVAVREGESWIPVPLKPLDGGAMGAIGSEGSGHEELHQPGGFAVPAKWRGAWQLQLKFRLPGVYKLIVAISPDNGETHLAQPASLTLEVL